MRDRNVQAGTTAELLRTLPDDFPYSDMCKPILMVLISVVPLIIVAQSPGVWNAPGAPVGPGAVLLVLIAMMIWPSAGTHRYLAYKTPLFIITIVFELWIMFAGVALRVPRAIASQDLWFQLVLAEFFLGTVVVSLPGLEGEYRNGLVFRPDLIYGNGAYLAPGEIFVALGVKLFTCCWGCGGSG